METMRTQIAAMSEEIQLLKMKLFKQRPHMRAYIRRPLTAMLKWLADSMHSTIS